MWYSKFLFLSFVIFFISCGQTSNDKSSLQETNETKDSFSYVEEVGQQLIYSLAANTVSQHEVRLCINFAGLSSAELFVMRDFDTRTFLNKYHFQQYGIINRDHIDSVALEIGLPSISTEQLIGKIYELNFRELVSQPDSIISMIGDGLTYTLEVRDSTYYKAICYNVPHEFQDPNHQTFMKIIGELEKAMNWKYEVW
jgi:hypothetical protein